jgi:thiopeptide-type bacteriocin biosynthesis protein
MQMLVPALEPQVTGPEPVHGIVETLRASWRLTKERLAPLTKAATAADRFAAAQRLREQLAWPRFVEVVDGDNELIVDLDNVLSIETFAALVKQRATVLLVELWPSPDELCMHGPEGRFAHELVVPYTRTRTEARVAPRRSSPAEVARRRLPPGSEWLYAKIYTGSGFCDRVLCEAVAPVVSRALSTGAAESWFFLRYGDPGWHLRVRFRGDRARLRTEVEPALSEALGPLFESGGVFRLVFDTYEREVERYGGAAGIAWSERLFHADSDAVLELLDGFAGDGAPAARWQLALRGMDQLLGDLGFDDAGRLAIVSEARASFGREYGVDTAVEKVLGYKFRKQRTALEALLDPANDATGPYAELLPALHRRSRAIREVGAALRAAPLSVPLEALAASYLHMYANRLLRAAARPQELVLYDFLEQLYEGRLARARQAAKRVVARHA